MFSPSRRPRSPAALVAAALRQHDKVETAARARDLTLLELVDQLADLPPKDFDALIKEMRASGVDVGALGNLIAALND